MMAAACRAMASSDVAAARWGKRGASGSRVIVVVGAVARATLTNRTASLVVMRPIRARVAAGPVSAPTAESPERPSSRREHSEKSAVIRMMVDCTRRSSANSRSRSRRMTAVRELRPTHAVLVMPSPWQRPPTFTAAKWHVTSVFCGTLHAKRGCWGEEKLWERCAASNPFTWSRKHERRSWRRSRVRPDDDGRVGQAEPGHERHTTGRGPRSPSRTAMTTGMARCRLHIVSPARTDRYAG